MPDQEKYLAQFIALVLKTNMARKQFVARGKTGTMTTIGQDDIASVKIFIPTKKEQEKIASFLSAVDNKLTQLRRKKELLETYKSGLMQKLFSQKVRFKQDNGSYFPDWEEKKIEDIFLQLDQAVPMKQSDLAPLGEINIELLSANDLKGVAKSKVSGIETGIIATLFEEAGIAFAFKKFGSAQT
jgi:type I restriction enzyme S subunit